MAMATTKFPIENIHFLSDGLMLNGALHLPGTHRPPVIIGSHGLYSSQNSPKQIELAQACNRLGMAYFRFDHRGCGSSQGIFDDVTSLGARCRDLKNAVQAIRNSGKAGPDLGLFGSSMGGTVCLSIAGKLNTSALVTFAAPIRSDIGSVQIQAPEGPAAARIYFDTAKQSFDICDKLPHIKNILIVHGAADETVPLSHAREIYRLAGDPKKLIVQQNGDHRMSNQNHQNEFIREASRWFKAGLIGL
jgi:alpha-beta hydrolase superfamily lysophospholipase